MGPTLPLWESVVRILVAMALAGLVGAERETRDQDAGLRTHLLVGVGAALFVVVGNYSWNGIPFGNDAGVVLDPSRVVAYVVTGIGFLGAGAIIKHGTNVRGLTTAASLWVVAATGVACGSGDYELAAIATGAVLLSLWPLRRIARFIGLRRSSAHQLEVRLGPDGSVAAAVERLERGGLTIESVRVANGADERLVEVLAHGNHATARGAVGDLAGVADVRDATLRS
ncbi:MAG: MgtC/SapB family protein [Thermoleophilia bacterium]